MRKLLGILALGLLASPAAAQDLQNFRPAPGVHGLLQTEGSGTTRPDVMAAALWLHYGDRPLVSRRPDGAVSSTLVDGMTAIDVLLSYGLMEGLDLTLHVPLAGLQGPALDTRGNDGFAHGDLRVNTRWRLVGDGKSGLGLGVGLPIAFPTGDDTRFLGGDGFVFSPRVLLDYHLSVLHLATNVGFALRTDPTPVGNLERGQDFTYSAGAAVDLGTPYAQFLLDWFGSVSMNDVLDDSVSTPMELMAALRGNSAFGGHVTLGGGFGVMPDFGAADFRVILGLTYEAPPAEKLAPVDSDGDGLLDPGDQCPVDPEDPDGFQDTDGCPDLDNDGDGLPDTRDACPNEPETFNKFNDADGCPDRGPARPEDSDGDGFLDREDRCPDDPEDIDNFQDRDGCPEPDNDGDGILDVDDKCPLAPENKDGIDDEDGCPEQRRVRVTKDKIELLERVFFDTAKATIREVSFALLDEVSEVILGYPQIEHIIVEGHTDRRGDLKRNLSLSRDRAKAVRQYLINRGVPQGRLSAVGYGPSRPLIQGSGPDVWSRNRRVEFRIATAAERPAHVDAVTFTATGADNRSAQFRLMLSQAPSGEAVRATLEEQGKVLVLHIANAQAERAWVKGISHPLVARALVEPSTERPPSIVLRVRLTTRIPEAQLPRLVHTKADGAAVVVTISPL